MTEFNDRRFVGHVRAHATDGEVLSMENTNDRDTTQTPLTSLKELGSSTTKKTAWRLDPDTNERRRVKVDHWTFRHPSGHVERL